MAQRKKPDVAPGDVEPAAPVAQVVTLDDGSTTTIVSATGIELDPADGRPVFADGMSRRRWLEAHADERKEAFLAELLTDTETE
jgi:hypothetical protein